jgi:hypothetical protein
MAAARVAAPPDDAKIIEAVKYVWVEQVLKVLVDAVAADPAARTVGVAELQLLPRLVDQQTATGPVAEGLRQVVRDLLT